MDINKDGRVSREELKEWFKKGRSRAGFVKKLSVLNKRFDALTKAFTE
jgi:hypothetical protein